MIQSGEEPPHISKKMKSESEINNLLSKPYKEIEHELGIKIRNGQTIEGIRKALKWMME